jgi:4-hydroxy-tetrahydrodipicolinate synthase
VEFICSYNVSFKSDLSLNIEKTIEHAEKLIDQGCHGTAIFGSTGQAQLYLFRKN